MLEALDGVRECLWALSAAFTWSTEAMGQFLWLPHGDNSFMIPVTICTSWRTC